MRVLLIKTSSMGDIIHTLPALSDAGLARPGISFDWLIEEPYASIPSWHPLVNKAIPIAFRRWRRGIFSRETRSAWAALRKQLQGLHYDLVLDAQGLVKSAFLARFAKGPKAGLDFKSAREAPAAWFYQRKYAVDFHQHAIVRMRKLFSLALDYEGPLQLSQPPDFGLVPTRFTTHRALAPYLVFLFGTTWASKQWPEHYWQRLAALARDAGDSIIVSGNTPEEIARADRIAACNPAVTVLNGLNIADMAALLAHAKAVVTVDTGFGHLSAALGVPTLSLYGPTDPAHTGALGPVSLHLAADFPCSPCFSRKCRYPHPAPTTPACYASLPPERVWQALLGLLPGHST